MLNSSPSKVWPESISYIDLINDIEVVEEDKYQRIFPYSGKDANEKINNSAATY